MRREEDDEDPQTALENKPKSLKTKKKLGGHKRVSQGKEKMDKFNTSRLLKPTRTFSLLFIKSFVIGH